MIRLLSKKQIYMEGGYMLGSFIVMFMFLMIFSMSIGVVLGKLLWTPPSSEKGI